MIRIMNSVIKNKQPGGKQYDGKPYDLSILEDLKSMLNIVIDRGAQALYVDYNLYDELITKVTENYFTKK